MNLLPLDRKKLRNKERQLLVDMIAWTIIFILMLSGIVAPMAAHRYYTELIEIKSKAVKSGLAKWEVDPETGRIKFVWINKSS